MFTFGDTILIGCVRMGRILKNIQRSTNILQGGLDKLKPIIDSQYFRGDRILSVVF